MKGDSHKSVLDFACLPLTSCMKIVLKVGRGKLLGAFLVVWFQCSLCIRSFTAVAVEGPDWLLDVLYWIAFGNS